MARAAAGPRGPEPAEAKTAKAAKGVHRRQALQGAAAGAAALAAQLPAAAPAQAGLFGGAAKVEPWTKVDLGLDDGIVLLDIAFVPTDMNHGFLLGTRQTLMETKDGGVTWERREIPAAQDDGFNYRFNSISFNGDNGYIVGKPAILLKTTDGGATWERVPLSSKLPGTPLVVTALEGDGNAEMTTDQGAIYVTSNGGDLWKAAVEETVDATLNRTVSSGISGASFYTGSFSSIKRGAEGNYIAVSSRGNFYMTWEPGQSTWLPHNRFSARRLQDMGFRNDGGLWMTARGGEVYYGEGTAVTEDFAPIKFPSRGYGILDIGYRNGEEAWASGGSGSLFQSLDGGKTWKREKSANDVAANLYAVKFFKEDLGFVLGNSGVLLRYTA